MWPELGPTGDGTVEVRSSEPLILGAERAFQVRSQVLRSFTVTVRSC